MTRISILPPDRVSLETNGYYQMSAATWGIVSNLIMIMGHCPQVTKTLVPFANSFIFFPIRGSRLDRKLRELIINRVSLYNESHYSITHHTLIALNSGVDPQKLLHIKDWQKNSIFSERERLALHYAELASADSNAVDDAFFSELKKHFSDQEIVEMTTIIGHFNLLNRWFNALHVEDEPDFLKLYYARVPPELQTSISYYCPTTTKTYNHKYDLTRPRLKDDTPRVPPMEPNDLAARNDFDTLSSYTLAKLTWRAGEINDPNAFDRVPNLIKTWGHCPEIARTLVPFVNSFLFNEDSTIDRGLKELAVNVVGRLNKTYYTTSAHELYAQAFGRIDRQQLDDLENWQSSTLFTDIQKLVIEYSIAVSLNSNEVTDELFGRIRNRFTEAETVELTLLICHFQLATRFINLMKIQVEAFRR